MQSWANYHSHTHYCDGSHEPEYYIKEAIKKKLPAYGFSSHAPVKFTTDWCIPNEQFGNYLSDIIKIKELNKGEIEVYLGLEIDYIPDLAGRKKQLLKNIPLDYFIGSIHFVDAFENGIPWNIDTSYELFQKGLKKIFNNNFQKAATRFYEITRQMIEDDQPDIVGHIDKIKMFNNREQYFTESEKWYRNQIDLTIASLKKNNTIVEVNTRGYYRYGQVDLYPGELILKKLAEADIPLMINSDAHKPEEIIMGLPFAAKKLLKLGIKKIYAIRSGKWNEYLFDEKGIFWKQSKGAI